MDKAILKDVIEKLEEKVNFRCTEKPEMKGCSECENECDAEHITWNCDGTLVMLNEVLEEKNVENKNEYIEYCQEHGGYCDCEVIFNVKDGV